MQSKRPTHEPSHPAQPPCLRLRSPSLNISPCPTITSTRGGRDKVVLPHAPHSAARDAIPKIFLVARARDSNLSAPPPCFSCGLSSGFSRRRLSRAHPTHVLLSTAHCKVHVRVPSARACGRCARRGWCVRLSPTSALTSPFHQQQAQGCAPNSNRKRTHVHTLCAGALYGALAGRVQLVERAARDRGSSLSTR